MKELLVLLAVFVAFASTACTYEAEEKTNPVNPYEKKHSSQKTNDSDGDRVNIYTQNNATQESVSFGESYKAPKIKETPLTPDEVAAAAARCLELGEFDFFSNSDKPIYAKTDYEALWKGLKIKSADVSSAGIPSQGNYLYEITLLVDEIGTSTFKKGVTFYILEVALKDNSAVILSLVPKDQWLDQGEVPLHQILRLTTHIGMKNFDSPSELSQEVLTLICMNYAAQDKAKTSAVVFPVILTKAEINSAASTYFAVQDLPQTDSIYYDAETGNYILEEIPIIRQNRRVTLKTKNPDGTFTFIVQSYADPLQTLPLSSKTYNMILNQDETWRFLSVQESDDMSQ